MIILYRKTKSRANNPSFTKVETLTAQVNSEDTAKFKIIKGLEYSSYTHRSPDYSNIIADREGFQI